jgi:hypothetical protein
LSRFFRYCAEATVTLSIPVERRNRLAPLAGDSSNCRKSADLAQEQARSACRRRALVHVVEERRQDLARARQHQPPVVEVVVSVEQDDEVGPVVDELRRESTSSCAEQ